jgi:phospholipid/cholesterol/gamma-HCH transport system substrate-binding protein
MKRGNEFAVGVAVLGALLIVIAAGVWLSDSRFDRREQTLTARFRTVDGLGVGAPVTVRGVRVGRVESIRLAPGGWVEADLSVQPGVELPGRPAVIAAPASLFGEWSATVTSLEPLPDDPNVRAELLAADAAGGPAIPGATLPDVGQLTAQASRIAGDIAGLTDRVTGAFDSAAMLELRSSILQLAKVSEELANFAQQQTPRIERMSDNLSSTALHVENAAAGVQRTVSRVDSATGNGEIEALVQNSRATTEDLRAAAADFRALMSAARQNEASMVRVVQSADSLMATLARGEGTLGMLAADSALYLETTLAMRQFRELMTDFQLNPRKYIKISVF